MRQLARVEKDIKYREETCLIGTILKGKIEVTKLKKKLRLDWGFMKGEIDVVDRTNNWFEVHFASKMDKELAWEKGRILYLGHCSFCSLGGLILTLLKR